MLDGNVLISLPLWVLADMLCCLGRFLPCLVFLRNFWETYRNWIPLQKGRLLFGQDWS